MKTVAVLSNDHLWTYNLRKELLERLLEEDYRVILILPYGEKVELLRQMGCEFIDVPMFERRGKNPIKEIELISFYYRTLKNIRPNVVLSYTIKPNLYGGYVAGLLRIPFIANITGLGTIAEGGIMSSLARLMYKEGLKNATCVFAQNKGNKEYLINNRIVDKNKIIQINGSGVNLSRFNVSEYPTGEVVKFCFISRILKEKGIEEYLEAARIVRKECKNTEFHVCGFCEDDYSGKLNDYIERQDIVYHGMIDDVPDFLSGMSCLIHPSYYLEGVSNVLLEACASGRPIITTDHEGCRETVDDGVNGYMVPVKNVDKLVEAVERFLSLSYKEKQEMGLAARKKVEEEFDRKLIVDAYMREVNKIE